MEKQRTCPACGKILKEDMHRGMAFMVQNQVPQMPLKRFWICDETIDSLEKIVKMYREGRWDRFTNIP